jgi:hypothetical protein
MSFAIDLMRPRCGWGAAGGMNAPPPNRNTNKNYPEGAVCPNCITSSSESAALYSPWLSQPLEFDERAFSIDGSLEADLAAQFQQAQGEKKK